MSSAKTDRESSGTRDRTIGLIAGDGRFPVLVARSASQKGIKVVAAGFQNMVDPELQEFTGEYRLFPFCLVGRIIEYLKKQGIDQVITIGTIPPVKLNKIEPQLDSMARELGKKISVLRTDSIMAGAVELLAEHGIQVLDSTMYISDHLAPGRVMTARQPSDEEWTDIRLGFKVAKAIGGFDIGQTVVVKKGAIIAVEAVEGTDQAIIRSAELTRPGAVVTKVAKPGQDMRFDVPAVGVTTLESMLMAQARVLAIEAGKVLIEDPEELAAKADENELTVVGIDVKREA